jgi:signal transduction histidine kinase
MTGHETLEALVSDVATSQEISATLERIVLTSLTLTQSERVTLAVLDEENNQLEIRYDTGGQELPDEGPNRMARTVRDEDDRLRAILRFHRPQDRTHARALASLVRIILEREARSRREEALIQIGHSLHTTLTENALIERVINIAEKVLRLQACSIFLIDRRTETAVLRGSIGSLSSQVGKLAYGIGEGFTGWVCATGQPILLDDPQSDPRWRGKWIEIPSVDIASFLAVPIQSRGKVLGVIRVLRRKTGNRLIDNRFTASDLRLLQSIAEQMAAGLENLRNFERIIRTERLAAWGELSAKSSHMIGNRVFALKGDVNELGHLLRTQDYGDLPSVQQSLQRNLLRIEETLQDFRDFVTATQIHRMPTDVGQVVRETVEEVFPRRGQVVAEVDIASGLIADVDPKRLRRAISELVENALNHVSEGWVRVTADLDDRRHAVRIIIEDSGVGVAMDLKSVIFEPFHSGRAKGMGLGLSIVKGIIDAHGGEIVEEGMPGAGARFVIRLPKTDVDLAKVP